MKQPVAGVAPSTLEEVTVMTVWPSVAATGWGRLWGRLSTIEVGGSLFGVPVTIGRILALVSIPFILPVYFHMLIPRLPFVFFGVVNSACRRYRLTNQRVIVEQTTGGEQRAISLDRFDDIEVVVLPGHDWYHAGDLVFKLGGVETFRLFGLVRPETFRRTCLKAQISHAGVQSAREAGVAV